MAKPLKIFLWIVAGLLVLFVGAAAAVSLIFDPNDYRDDIATAVEDATGRTLVIEGDLSLNFFPWLGVEIGATRLGNAEGFGPEPFAAIDNVGVAVAVMPLLKKQIVVDTVLVDGLKLNLARNAQGTGNWEDLAAAGSSEPDAEPEPDTKTSGPAPEISINSIQISNAAVRFADKQAGATYAVEPINLSTGAVSLGEPIDITLGLTLTSDAPEVVADLTLKATVESDMEANVHRVRDIQVNVDAEGPTLPNGKQTLTASGRAEYDGNAGTASFGDGSMAVGELVLALSAQASNLNAETPAIEATVSSNEFSPRKLMRQLGVEPPPTTDPKVLEKAKLSASMSGSPESLTIPDLKLTLDDTTLGGTVRVVDVAKQAIRFDLKADRFDADRYMPPKAEGEEKKDSGSGSPTAGINDIRIPAEVLDQINAVGTARLNALKVSGLNFSDVLLKVDAATGKPKTQELTAKGYGGTIRQTSRLVPSDPPRLATTVELGSVAAGNLLRDFLGKEYVQGTASMSMDLSSTGVTVGDLRKALSGTIRANVTDGAVQGFNVAQTIRTARARLRGEQVKSDAQQSTDFANLDWAASIKDGLLTTETLNAKNPLLRLTGSGKVDLVSETIEFIARPTVVETSKGQGGDDLEDLKGITIPIKLAGSLFDPSVKVDLESVLKSKAKQEVDKQKDKLRDKMQEKLGDFFKGG